VAQFSCRTYVLVNNRHRGLSRQSQRGFDMDTTASK